MMTDDNHDHTQWITQDARSRVYVLFHLVELVTDADRVILGPGICINRMSGTRLERQYHAQCAAFGIDEGEPLMFLSCALLDYRIDGDSYPQCACCDDSVIASLCNLITVFLEHPIPTVRVMHQGRTHRCFTLTGQVEFLESNHLRLDQNALDQLPGAWRTICSLNRTQSLSVAVTNFFRAWRYSQTLDQTCLWLNAAAGALGYQADRPSPEYVGEIAETLGRLDAAASEIAAGSMCDEDVLCDVVPTAFVITARLIQSRLVGDSASLTEQQPTAKLTE